MGNRALVSLFLYKYYYHSSSTIPSNATASTTNTNSDKVVRNSTALKTTTISTITNIAEGHHHTNMMVEQHPQIMVISRCYGEMKLPLAMLMDVDRCGRMVVADIAAHAGNCTGNQMAVAEAVMQVLGRQFWKFCCYAMISPTRSGRDRSADNDGATITLVP
ncbi:hypothetical protein Ancab_022581 [Ancistrocladus abbreviatus]